MGLTWHLPGFLLGTKLKLSCLLRTLRPFANSSVVCLWPDDHFIYIPLSCSVYIQTGVLWMVSGWASIWSISCRCWRPSREWPGPCSQTSIISACQTQHRGGGGDIALHGTRRRSSREPGGRKGFSAFGQEHHRFLPKLGAVANCGPPVMTERTTPDSKYWAQKFHAFDQLKL